MLRKLSMKWVIFVNSLDYLLLLMPGMPLIPRTLSHIHLNLKNIFHKINVSIVEKHDTLLINAQSLPKD
jgi:hypothetical protein